MVGGTPYTCEHRLQRADGSWTWHVSRALPIKEEQGTIRKWYGTATDIHELKRTEQALQELNATLASQVAERTLERDRTWQISHDLFAVADFTGRLRSVNPAWTRLLGYDEQTLLSRPFAELIHPDDLAAAASIVDGLRRGEPVLHFQDRLRHRVGRWRWISWTAVAEGEVFYAVGRDVTEERLKDEQLRQAQKMETLGQLTGGIAHDFNNLLMGMSGSLELVRKRLASGRTTDLDGLIDAGIAAAQRAAGLTQRLLAFARRQALNPRPIEVRRLVGSMEELLRRTLGERIELRFVLPDDLWSTEADANQLENAVLNLAVNARDAMPEGGRLMIEAVNVRLPEANQDLPDGVTPGEYVAIVVSDTGVGMPPGVVERVFEPFFTTKPIGQGTGLGLSMVYGFVAQSRGQVRVASEPGQGTSVSMYLPRHETGPDEPGPASRPPAPEAEAGETVLVVEDDPVVRLLVTQVLSDLGYAALEAADGTTALPILQSRRRLDLLITDIGLPGINGRQLAETARQHRADLPILFMTGYAKDVTVQATLLGAGMRMITKPFGLADLAAKIREMIKH